MDKKQSKQKIESLVQTFHTKKHEKMNEAETRLRFIDPFFEALGWNQLPIQIEDGKRVLWPDNQWSK